MFLELDLFPSSDMVQGVPILFGPLEIDSLKSPDKEVKPLICMSVPEVKLCQKGTIYRHAIKIVTYKDKTETKLKV
jgi:hypothetical protein